MGSEICFLEEDLLGGLTSYVYEFSFVEKLHLLAETKLHKIF